MHLVMLLKNCKTQTVTKGLTLGTPSKNAKYISPRGKVVFGITSCLNLCSLAALYKEYRMLKEAKEKTTSENEDHVHKKDVQSPDSGVRCLFVYLFIYLFSVSM